MLKWDPLSDWDRRIMERMPHVADLLRFGEFDAAVLWASQNIPRADYTYKSYRFFFRNAEDYVLFTMRWS
jgi:hypothetical protein